MGLDKKIFAKQLRQVRTDSKLTGAVLAEKIGVKREAIVNLESGRRSPSVDTLCDLAQALNVSTDYLLGISAPAPMARPVPEWVADLLDDLGRLNQTGREAVKALIQGLKQRAQK
jgi:transcriptional regulator with XRE-family HTH domain